MQKPFRNLTPVALDFTGLPQCIVCQLPVPKMNSATAHDAHFTTYGGMCKDTKHKLRIIIDGETRCPGSPSRAQYIPGQPRDTRPQFSVISQYGIRNHRDADYGARFSDAALSPIPKRLEEGQTCPSCRHVAKIHVWGAYRRSWIVQLHCPNCDAQDIERPVFAVPFSSEDGMASAWQALDMFSIGLLGLGALRMPMAEALQFDRQPAPADLPELTEVERRILESSPRIAE